MDKEHASLEMVTPTRVISSMGFSMARGSSAGQTVQRIEESSEVTKLLGLVVINGQMAQLMKDKSKMA
jgi:hypothetical protein